MDVKPKAVPQEPTAKSNGQLQAEGQLWQQGQPLLVGAVSAESAGAVSAGAVSADSAGSVSGDSAGLAGAPQLESLSPSQIADLKLVDVLRLELAGAAPQNFWERQITIAKQFFPEQALGLAQADASATAYDLAAEAGASVFWGSLECLGRFASQVGSDRLSHISWVLTASNQAASGQELADFDEQLQRLYLELPLGKLTSRSSDLAVAVDLRSGSAVADPASQTALAVWAMFQQASLLVTDDIQAAYQARQVCFRKLAA